MIKSMKQNWGRLFWLNIQTFSSLGKSLKTEGLGNTGNFLFFFVADSEITSNHGKRCYLTFPS